MKHMSGWVPADWEPLSEGKQRALRARAEKCLPRALKLLGAGAAGDRLEAENAILQAAEGFLRWSALERTSPTVASAKSELGELRRWAVEGEARLASLGPWLVTIGALEPERLGAIQQNLETLRDDAESWAKRIADGTGRPNKRLWPAPAKRELVVRCLDLFERYRPGEASSAINGDFARFVHQVHLLATGNPGGLEKPIKQVVPAWRRRRENIAAWERSREGRRVRLLELNSRRLELEGRKRLDAAARRELEAVEKEYAAVLAELSESGT